MEYVDIDDPVYGKNHIAASPLLARSKRPRRDLGCAIFVVKDSGKGALSITD